MSDFKALTPMWNAFQELRGESFLLKAFQILEDGDPGMTVTEVLERYRDERGHLPVPDRTEEPSNGDEH